MWEKGTLIHCRWERNLVQPLCKSVLMFIKKLKIELTTWWLPSPGTTPEYIHRASVNTPQKYLYLDAYCCTAQGRQEMEVTWIPINRYIHKENMGLRHNWILWWDKEKWNVDNCKNMNETRYHYIKQNKPNLGQQTHLFPHMWTLHFNLCMMQIMHMYTSPYVCRLWKFIIKRLQMVL